MVQVANEEGTGVMSNFFSRVMGVFGVGMGLIAVLVSLFAEENVEGSRTVGVLVGILFVLVGGHLLLFPDKWTGGGTGGLGGGWFGDGDNGG